MSKMVLVFNNGEEWSEMTEEYPAYAMRITDEEYEELLDAGTTSMNSMLNEGLRVIRDMKMDNIAQQRKRRESLSNW